MVIVPKSLVEVDELVESSPYDLSEYGGRWISNTEKGSVYQTLMDADDIYNIESTELCFKTHEAAPFYFVTLKNVVTRETSKLSRFIQLCNKSSELSL